MVNVAILGATGYSGKKLTQILIDHKKVKIIYLSSRKERGSYSKLFPEFSKKINLSLKKPLINEVVKNADIVFLSLPHRVSMSYVPRILKKRKDIKIIDLSADYRLKNPLLYKKFYNTLHKDKVNLRKAIYGLPEIFRREIKKARLIANPGCYATGAILSLYPLVKAGLIKRQVFIDAKSGASGAGRKATLELSFCEVNENVKCYKPLIHPHRPEIEEILREAAHLEIRAMFVPHLLPMNRGIISTIYAYVKSSVKEKNLFKAFSLYDKEPFVRVRPRGYLPRVKDVLDSNYCDIGWRFFKEEGVVIVVSCIDNLMKGASAQAVQNMNIICGFKEEEGLV